MLKVLQHYCKTMPYKPSGDEKYRNKEWLREKYKEEKLSTREIAELADCTAPTIQDWLERLGIEKRSKSKAAKIRAEKHPQTWGTENIRDYNWWNYADSEERDAFREWLSEKREGDNNPMADVTGRDHPNWKENTPDDNFYQSKKWKKTREQVLKRDNNQCQACGKSENLHVHHIMPVSSGGPRYATDNLVTLCRTHHKEWEGIPVRPVMKD